jgi:hypothetical protein
MTRRGRSVPLPSPACVPVAPGFPLPKRPRRPAGAVAICPGNSADDRVYVPPSLRCDHPQGERPYLRRRPPNGALAKRPSWRPAATPTSAAGGRSTQPGSASRIVASGVGGHAGIGTSTLARLRGTVGRIVGGWFWGDVVLAPRWTGRAASDGAPLAGAVAGLRTGLGGRPGTSIGQGRCGGVGARRTRRGKEWPFDAELMRRCRGRLEDVKSPRSFPRAGTGEDTRGTGYHDVRLVA